MRSADISSNILEELKAVANEKMHTINGNERNINLLE
jgi:hypothetical protein